VRAAAVPPVVPGPAPDEPVEPPRPRAGERAPTGSEPAADQPAPAGDHPTSGDPAGDHPTSGDPAGDPAGDRPAPGEPAGAGPSGATAVPVPGRPADRWAAAARRRLDRGLPLAGVRLRRWLTPAAGERADRWLALAGWVVVALGIGLRVRQWLVGRSFWLDEGALWLAMHDLNFGDLTKPLARAQAAPIAWLWTEHVVMSVFGDGERAARFPSLLFGCGALVLAALLARRLLGGPAALAAIVLVTFSPLLAYYSDEFKQYGGDVFWALLLLLLGVGLAGRERPRIRQLVTLAGTATVAVWFSHAAVLVAAGVLGALGLLALADRHWRRFVLLLLASVPPLVSIAVEYAVALSKTVDNNGLQTYWGAGFPPEPFGLSSFLRWAGDSGPRLMDRPLALTLPYVVLALVAGGLVTLALRRGRALLVLLMPLVVLLAAATVHAYPVADRLVLFAVPVVLLLLAAPVDLIRRGAGRVDAGVGLLAVAGVAALVLPGVRDAARHAVTPAVREESRPVVQFVAERIRPGDVVLADTTEIPTDLYGPRFGLDPAQVRVVAAPGPGCQPGLAQTRLKANYDRVWLFFGHEYDGRPAETRDGMRAHLATIGHRTEGIAETGASADLYDLGQPADDPDGTDPVLGLAGATCLYVP
jgi:hypothetical protein